MLLEPESQSRAPLGSPPRGTVGGQQELGGEETHPNVAKRVEPSSGPGPRRESSFAGETITVPPGEWQGLPLQEYELALRADIGESLGSTLAGTEDLLVVGWKGFGLISEDFAMGPVFYTRAQGTHDVSLPQELPSSAASRQVTCLYGEAFARCNYHNVDRENSGVAWNVTELWPDTGDLPAVGGCASQGCSLLHMSLWMRTAAVVYRNMEDGGSFVATFTLEISPAVRWVCTSGCGADVMGGQTARVGGGAAATGHVWSTVSIWERMAVVAGSSASSGFGEVELWRAVGAQSAGNTLNGDVQVQRDIAGWHQGWSYVQSLTGLAEGGIGRFGTSLSLGPSYLAVGGTGGSEGAGGVGVYSVGSGDDGLHRMCLFRDANTSLIGWVLDQHESDGETHLAVGAPGANRVYMMNVGMDLGCVVTNRLVQSTTAPPWGKHGYSLAISHNWVVVGTPEAHGPVNGLIYIYSYCSARQYLQSSSMDIQLSSGVVQKIVWRECRVCPDPFHFSPGPQSTTCEPCLPEYGVWNTSCSDYTCQEGYFGSRCNLCSVYAGTIIGMAKPQNAYWVDGRRECTWGCSASFYSKDGECVACERGNESSLSEEDWIVRTENVDWKMGKCEWTCSRGYYNSTGGPMPRCSNCSVWGYEVGLPWPNNTVWIEGNDGCVWVPVAGFQCNAATHNCSECPAKPEHSHWNSTWETRFSMSQCEYTCDAGFFGHRTLLDGVCVLCSQLLGDRLPEAVRPSLPEHAFWRDDVAVCDGGGGGWDCTAGYSKSVSVDGICCPGVVPNSTADDSAQPCPFKCNTGFRKTEAGVACEACPSHPDGAEWVPDAPVECAWGPAIGYQCGESSCSPCSGKPARASYIQQPLTETTTGRCEYSCDDGFYGHGLLPWNEVGVCVKCSVLLEEELPINERPKLPTHAFWRDDLGSCNSESWDCPDPFVRSNDPEKRFCCPPSIPDSSPDPSSITCGIRCNLGYRWKEEEAVCEPCPAGPSNKSHWVPGELDCVWECDGALHGEELGLCVECAEYWQALGISAPDNAVWPASSEQCDSESYICPEGTSKNVDADPAGCCPGIVTHGTLTGPVEDCNFKCDEGFTWSKGTRSCESCYDSGPIDPPSGGSSTWNQTRCARECDEGFVPFPDFPARPTRCETCPEHAVTKGWSKPPHSVWREPFPYEAHLGCNDQLWVCDESAGYEMHGDRKRCCFSQDVVVPIDSSDLWGGWLTDECRWECWTSRFPTLPVAKSESQAGISCLTCEDYLSQYAIELPRLGDGREKDDRTRTCTVEIKGILVLSDLGASDFEVQHVKVLRDATADATGAAPVDIALVPIGNSGISSVSGTSGSIGALSGGGGARRAVVAEGSHLVLLQTTQRERGEGQLVGGADMESGRRQNNLQTEVLMTIKNVDPARASLVRSDLLSAVRDRRLTAALTINGLEGDVTLSWKGFTLSPSMEAWKCKAPSVLNQVTSVCCAWSDGSPEKNALMMDSATRSKRDERAKWDIEGCKVIGCSKGFHLYEGFCYTCSELNPVLADSRFLPLDAEWVEGREDCSQWQCKPGFVKSVSGYSCVNLTMLQSSCARYTRCGTCVNAEHCVWCGSNINVDGTGSCIPGQAERPLSKRGCRYSELGTLMEGASCTCEANQCDSECKHTDCDACSSDHLCGWCSSTKTCMQVGVSGPKFGECLDGWKSSGSCHTDLVIALVCAGVSSAVVTFMCCYICIRVHRRRRESTEAASPQQPSTADAQAIISNLHSFQYKSPHLPEGPETPSASDEHPSDQDDQDERSCCICLGNYSEGDDLRMLPCLHVFHSSCVDHWLTVSLDCPLCKMAVENPRDSGHSRRAILEAERLFLMGRPHLAPAVPDDQQQDTPRSQARKPGCLSCFFPLLPAPPFPPEHQQRDQPQNGGAEGGSPSAPPAPLPDGSDVEIQASDGAIARAVGMSLEPGVVDAVRLRDDWGGGVVAIPGRLTPGSERDDDEASEPPLNLDQLSPTIVRTTPRVERRSPAAARDNLSSQSPPSLKGSARVSPPAARSGGSSSPRPRNSSSSPEPYARSNWRIASPATLLMDRGEGDGMAIHRAPGVELPVHPDAGAESPEHHPRVADTSLRASGVLYPSLSLANQHLSPSRSRVPENSDRRTSSPTARSSIVFAPSSESPDGAQSPSMAAAGTLEIQNGELFKTGNESTADGKQEKKKKKKSTKSASQAWADPQSEEGATLARTKDKKKLKGTREVTLSSGALGTRSPSPSATSPTAAVAANESEPEFRARPIEMRPLPSRVLSPLRFSGGGAPSALNVVNVGTSAIHQEEDATPVDDGK